MKKKVLSLLFIMAFIACKNVSTDKGKAQKANPAQAIDKVTSQEEGDWEYLFDGSTLEGWRGYNEDSLPPGWTIKDKVLTYDTDLALEQDYKGGRDIIYGAEKFENFVLYLEWKLPKGGNSGIFYHIKEGYDSPSEVAPEYQLIDDENYAEIHDLTGYNKSLGYTKNLSELKSMNHTGADYAMHPVDSTHKVLHPVGEWNSSKIVFTPEKVEHWLNGKKIVSFKPWSADWYKRKKAGKWKDSPEYGKYQKGYIGLQDHASPIWFRNIKIKAL